MQTLAARKEYVTLVAFKVNIHFVDSSMDTYEISVISVDAGNTLYA